VIFLGPDGRLLGRHAQNDIDAPGDAPLLLAEMQRVLAETKRIAEGAIPEPAEGRERIGKPLPEWSPDGWLTGEPRRLEQMRGEVLLVRFFTDRCPFCAVSMPALQALQDKHHAAGLRIVGFFHPKPRGSSRDLDALRALLAEWQVTFPIALDTRWTTLDAWWLANQRRRFTSVSFLLDRKGRVRFLHPGPELHQGEAGCTVAVEDCNRSHADLEAAIRKLLAETS